MYDTKSLNIRPICRDTSGSVVILFALLAPTVLAVVGLAMDVGRAVSYRSTLSRAADAAVLAAVKEAISRSGTSSNASFAAAPARSQGMVVWAENTTHVASANITLTITFSGGTWTAVARYSGAAPTTMGLIFGKSTFEVGGTATASAGVDTKSYTNIYLLLDISQSMALPSTNEGVSYLKMINPGCQFACHVRGYELTFNMLRAKNYPMRIDTLRQSAINMANLAASQNSSNINIGAWTFNNQVVNISSVSNDYSQLKRAIERVDVATHHDGTQFDDAVAAMTNTIPSGGDGKSSTTPSTFLFVITDGVQDGYYTLYRPPLPQYLNNIGIRIASITPSACDELKRRNVKIAVLYTSYIPQPSSVLYQAWIMPKAERIPIQLKACASDGLFFEASDHEAIKAAMSKMFTTAVSVSAPPRLTN